jgi:hypothetical protein
MRTYKYQVAPFDTHTHTQSVSLTSCHFHSIPSVYNTEVHLPVIKVPNLSSPQLQDKDVQKCYGLCANYSARGSSGCAKEVLGVAEIQGEKEGMGKFVYLSRCCGSHI